jgi:F-type H+-transporting ATPase subunit delta
VQPIAVARRYARALADAAGSEPKLLDRLAADLRLAAGAIGGDPRLLGFFADPSVDGAHRDAVVDTLARRGKMHALAAAFLKVLVCNRRMANIAPIARAFGEIRDRRLGLVEAETTVAVALTPAQETRLRESLQKVTGRSVRLRVKVDPALLGGARTRIGSRVYDGSLKRQLAILRERLGEAR